MKFKSYLYVPLCSAMAIFAMTSCSDDFGNDTDTRPTGHNGIVFGATAGYAGDADSKTEYGTINGNLQEIRWADGDRVDIYSPTSPNQQQVEYEISHIGESTGENQTADRGKGYLAAIQGQNGLQWASGTQSFYAVYPSKNSIENQTIRNMVSFNDGTLTGYVPVNQQHTITKGGETGWTAIPNMDYLYMTAINENFHVPTDDTDGGVSLDFVPLTTTLEITLTGPSSALASLNVFSDNVPVVGHFTCDLDNPDKREEGYPVCESTQQGTTNNYATISLYYDDNGTQKPLTLGQGESITFQVFLLPTAPLTNVKLRIAGFNTASKSMTLVDPDKNTPITLNPHKKTRVTIPAPTIGAETNQWITGINDNVYVSQLSIPGTANSFSYMRNEGVNSHYQTQTATIEEQWNAGIRCFELRGPNSSTNDLADAPLQCNRQNLGITFGQAVERINALVQDHPGEFAMIMPAFESDAGRAPVDYANDLNNFFQNHNYNYKTYNRDMIVKDARGSLMFIARITSEEDSEATLAQMPKPVEGVFIDQWGSLKDNWARRGYPVNNWARNSVWGSEEQMEYYMLNSNRSADFNPTILPQKGTVDFLHHTTRSDSEGSAYVQDWNRVVPEEQAGNHALYSDYYLGWGWQLNYTQYVYWAESFTEKCRDVWNTFLFCIEDNNNQQGSTFYINSLDGYFIDPSIEQSIIPYVEGRSDSYNPGEIGGNTSFSYTQGGMAGNIGAFAAAINDYFYNEILNYGENNIYGPMNIIILDRVYTDEAGSYLPSVIINNNYRFPLMTSDAEPSQVNADGVYEAVGNVWE